MKKNLKFIFKNKLIVLVFIILIVFSFISVNNLKTRSQTRYEYQIDHMRSTLAAIYNQEDYPKRLARLQDTSSDKRLYNNFSNSIDYLKKETSQMVDKMREGQDVEYKDILKIDILNDLIFLEIFSGLYGEELISPLEAFPDKINAFLEEIEFKYNIEDINFLREVDDPPPLGDRMAYMTKMLEDNINIYFGGGKLPVNSEYSIYNYIRNINYGSDNSWTYFMETFSIATIPLLIYYIISEQKKNGTIKNIYLRPSSKIKNYFFFVVIFIIMSLLLIYLPVLISSLKVLIDGELYDAKLDFIVYENGLHSFESSYDDIWLDLFYYGHGLTDIKVGMTGKGLNYQDLAIIGPVKFLLYFMTIDLLKILLVVLTSAAICLFIKNKIGAFSLNLFMSLMLVSGGKRNSDFFTNKFNPFILPNGWKLTIGRQYISYYNAVILLIAFIIIVLLLSIFLARYREIE